MRKPSARSDQDRVKRGPHSMRPGCACFVQAVVFLHLHTLFGRLTVSMAAFRKIRTEHQGTACLFVSVVVSEPSDRLSSAKHLASSVP